MDRLKEKVAIITGAAGGLCGKASEFFCAEGAKVVMVDKDPKVTDDCAKIVADGGDAIALILDVSIRENWDKILDATIEKYGTVDIMVKVAAEFSLTGDFDSGETDERFEQILHTNLLSLRHSYATILKYDVAWGMVYLCSDEAKYVNGVCLSIDGGWDAART